MKHILIHSQVPHLIKNQIINKQLFNGCILDIETQIVWAKYININYCENELYWVVPDNCYLTDIDDVINNFPSVILIFWFMYMKNQTLYNKIIQKYKNNVLNIDLFTTPDDILLMIDENNEINKEGLYLLDHMIRRF